MIRISIAIEDITLWDRLFIGYGAGPGAGPPSVDVFKLLLLEFMTNEYGDLGWCAILPRLLLLSSAVADVLKKLLARCFFEVSVAYLAPETGVINCTKQIKH